MELEYETNESRQGAFLNRDCALTLDLESMLLWRPPQNPFSTALVKSGPNADVRVESDLAPIADVGRAPWHVAEVPKPDSCTAANSIAIRSPRRPARAA